MPKYPDVRVQLTGNDGNVFVVIANCKKAALQAGIPENEVGEFTNKVFAADDYDHVLRICMEYFNCE